MLYVARNNELQEHRRFLQNYMTDVMNNLWLFLGWLFRGCQSLRQQGAGLGCH